MTKAPSWIEGIARGERASLARAITAVENGTADAPAVMAAIREGLGRALVVGITGPPGAGKSTLVAALIGDLRRRDLTVGVVAVDPSSPVTGGAILGDRIRMGRHAEDEGVFVRSLAARGHLGGLARSAHRVIDVMDASGRDIVLVETVGTGQSEVEIAGIADLRVVVVAPGLGDEVQAIKAGILEIADLFVVNKADQPLAQRTARQLAAAASLAERDGPPPAVLKTTATSGEGVAALAEAVLAHRQQTGRRLTATWRRSALATAAAEALRRRIEAGGAAVDELARELAEGRLDSEAALDQLVKDLTQKKPSPPSKRGERVG